MPFDVIENITKQNMPPLTKQNMPPRAKLSYMRPTGRGKNGGKHRDDAKPQLMITIPTTVCGTAKARTFQLLLGSGTDKGKLRVKGVKDKAGGVEAKELMHAFVFRFGYVPRLGDEIFDGEHRPVRKISDDEFEIDVPESWFSP